MNRNNLKLGVDFISLVMFQVCLIGLTILLSRRHEQRYERMVLSVILITTC